jgi:predicted DNA-binding protein
MANNKTIGVRVSMETFDFVSNFSKSQNKTTSDIIREIIPIIPAFSGCETWDMLIALEKFSGKTKSEIIREMLNYYLPSLYNKIPKDKL